MRILSWNIRQGGGSRLARIAATIRGHNPDVVALAEYKPVGSARLRDELVAAGWKFTEQTPSVPGVYGMMIASRVPMERRQVAVTEPTFAARWIEVHFPRKAFTLASVHVPTNKEAMPRFWRRIHEVADVRRSGHFLFIGDLNTGQSTIDAENGRFSCDEYFCGMPLFGFTDAWRHLNRAALEYTWYSTPKSGARQGFRIDHAFASKAMLRRVRECRYSHDERLNNASDHSSLLLTVR